MTYRAKQAEAELADRHGGDAAFPTSARAQEEAGESFAVDLAHIDDRAAIG